MWVSFWIVHNAKPENRKITVDFSELQRRAWRANFFFLPAIWLVLFLPAWTLRYWQAWLYWLLYAALTVAGTTYLLKHDPKRVERRLSAGPTAEKEKTQKVIMVFASICFVLSLVIPGIDHHLHWSNVPPGSCCWVKPPCSWATASCSSWSGRTVMPPRQSGSIANSR